MEGYFTDRKALGQWAEWLVPMEGSGDYLVALAGVKQMFVYLLVLGQALFYNPFILCYFSPTPNQSNVYFTQICALLLKPFL